jgi:hypothetical protein
LPALTALTASIDRAGQSWAVAGEFKTSRTAAVTAPHHVRNGVI